MEIPPRARRRDLKHGRRRKGHGNTSACAEKSQRPPFMLVATRKYLRVRGEEASPTNQKHHPTEIPPRARRRVQSGPDCSICFGNTSACAEKRHSRYISSSEFWKYLRVRGEEGPFAGANRPASEIPPRARRRVYLFDSTSHSIGNTSACAEKRVTLAVLWMRLRKYLRVRGEESC